MREKRRKRGRARYTKNVSKSTRCYVEGKENLRWEKKAEKLRK